MFFVEGIWIIGLKDLRCIGLVLIFVWGLWELDVEVVGLVMILVMVWGGRILELVIGMFGLFILEEIELDDLVFFFCVCVFLGLCLWIFEGFFKLVFIVVRSWFWLGIKCLIFFFDFNCVCK